MTRASQGLATILGGEWCGVDFDGCYDARTADCDDRIDAVVHRLGSYTEISPTGTGLKTLVKGDKPGGRCKCGDPDVECYARGRYFTVTGGTHLGRHAKHDHRRQRCVGLAAIGISDTEEQRPVKPRRVVYRKGMKLPPDTVSTLAELFGACPQVWIPNGATRLPSKNTAENRA